MINPYRYSLDARCQILQLPSQHLARAPTVQVYWFTVFNAPADDPVPPNYAARMDDAVSRIKGWAWNLEKTIRSAAADPMELVGVCSLSSQQANSIHRLLVRELKVLASRLYCLQKAVRSCLVRPGPLSQVLSEKEILFAQISCSCMLSVLRC